MTTEAIETPEQLEPEETNPAGKGALPGHRLLEVIRLHLKKIEQTEKALPAILGVTPVYWTHLANGTRRISGLPKDKMKRLADWLEISVIQAYLLADLFEPSDLFSTSTLDEDIAATRVKMLADRAFAPYAPGHDDWEATPRQSKIAMALLYERAAGERLLRRAQFEGNEHRSIGILEF